MKKLFAVGCTALLALALAPVGKDQGSTGAGISSGNITVAQWGKGKGKGKAPPPPPVVTKG
jgi:hypothetical protein